MNRETTEDWAEARPSRPRQRRIFVGWFMVLVDLGGMSGAGWMGGWVDGIQDQILKRVFIHGF